MTTFPTSQWGRLPPIINGTAGEEIAAEHYSVNPQLNSCHRISAEISSSLQKVNDSDIRTFLRQLMHVFILPFISCLALSVFSAYVKWCQPSSRINKVLQSANILQVCIYEHTNASGASSHTCRRHKNLTGREMWRRSQGWLIDLGMVLIVSMMEGVAPVCMCTRLCLCTCLPELYWSCARGMG